MRKKFLVVIMIVIMITSIVPFGLINASAERISSKDTFDTFASDTTDLIQKYDSKSENTEVATSCIEDNEEEGNFALKRLIVKVKKGYKDKIDDLGAIAKVEGHDRLHILQYATAEEAEAAYNKYLTMMIVEYVEPDLIVEIAEDEVKANETIIDSTEEYLSWGADDMGVDVYNKYLKEEIGEENLPIIKVAVVDSGIDTDHEMFGGFYDKETNPSGRILKNGTNFSATGAVGSPEDDHHHGTHVSGTVVDLTLDNVKILPIKVLDSENHGTTITVANGIEYAVNSGVQVINLSLGVYGDSEQMREKIFLAYEQNISVVAGSGNSNRDARDFYPAGTEPCITVAAADSELNRSIFSNYGDVIDVIAPGIMINSAEIGGGYICRSGTSMATPHVAAAIALYLSKDISMTNAEIEATLKFTARDLGDSGFDIYNGYGFVTVMKDIPEFVLLEFSHVKEEYNEPIELEITPSDSEAKIYYTIDGTEPTETSETYTEPITVDRTSKVSAVAYKYDSEGNITKKSLLYKKDFYIAETQPRYSFNITEDGYLTGINGVASMTEIAIPAVVNGITVRGLEEDFAEEYRMLENVTFEENPQFVSIGARAFLGCKEIKSITIPDSVTTIGEDAFKMCYKFLKIYGKKGSAAEEYAIANNITFCDIKTSEETSAEFMVTFIYGKVGQEKRITQMVKKGDEIVAVPRYLTVLKEKSTIFRMFTGRWLNEDGQVVDPEDVVVLEDTVFRAEYRGLMSYILLLIIGALA